MIVLGMTALSRTQLAKIASFLFVEPHADCSKKEKKMLIPSYSGGCRTFFAPRHSGVPATGLSILQ